MKVSGRALNEAILSVESLTTEMARGVGYFELRLMAERKNWEYIYSLWSLRRADKKKTLAAQ